MRGWRDGEPEWAETAAGRAQPGRVRAPRAEDPRPGFLDRLEVRPVLPVSVAARNLAWLRFDPRGRSTTSRYGALRTAGCRRLSRSSAGSPRAPTLDLTIHFRAPVAGNGCWPTTGRASAGGAWEEDGELWGADGTLLAQSRQLALIRA